MKTGEGVLKLTGVNTYSGETVVEAGRFKVTGSIFNTSRVTVGESATLELAGATGSATAASLTIDNDGTIVVSTAAQKVGIITGTGITQVNSGASLTAISIIQDSLIIGFSGSGMSSEIPGNVVSSVSQVPEPSTFVLLAAGAFGLLACVTGRVRTGH